MKLIVMTQPTFFVEEDKILASLFDGGLDNLHLYKPHSEPMYSERLLTLLPKEYYSKITVHDTITSKRSINCEAFILKTYLHQHQRVIAEISVAPVINWKS